MSLHVMKMSRVARFWIFRFFSSFLVVFVPKYFTGFFFLFFPFNS